MSLGFPPFTVSFLSLRNVGSTHSDAQLLQAEERHRRANNRTGHSQRAGGYHRRLASQCVSTWEEGGANIDTLAYSVDVKALGRQKVTDHANGVIDEWLSPGIGGMTLWSTDTQCALRPKIHRAR